MVELQYWDRELVPELVIENCAKVCKNKEVVVDGDGRERGIERRGECRIRQIMRKWMIII